MATSIAVIGLWHLGSVTSACLASLGHRVTAFDPDPGIVAQLSSMAPPVAEPGLVELLEQAVAAGRLRFATDRADAVRGAEVVWITFDTPVDDDDRADVDAVLHEIELLIPHLGDDATVLLSSQLPVGTARRVEHALRIARPEDHIGVACSPENLRLGEALESFLGAPRIVVGARRDRDRDRIAALLQPLPAEILWMSPESAEMSKHALNVWLAASVAFTNEVARLCEETGARADDIERALRSEPRIGERAYVHAGGAFAGGTLARDLQYLREVGAANDSPTPVLDGVRASNEWHLGWAQRIVEGELGDLRGRRIAVLGLTYKPGTDTLRRSAVVPLCRSLVSAGAEVRVHDPTAGLLPSDLRVERAGDAAAAVRGANAVVVGTPWPEYASVVDATMLATLRSPSLVVDPTGVLGRAADDPGVVYRTVGRPR